MNRIRFAPWTCGAVAFAILAMSAVLSNTVLRADPPAAEPAPAKPLDKAALEKKFTELLSGCTLVGHYTEGADKNDHEDRYSISKVSKIKDDLWLFNARIEVEGHDVTLPIPIRVVWAGDTPVITLDELTIPGLGTFSSRVLFHGHQYAGVWTHGDDGGQMWGAVERTKKE